MQGQSDNSTSKMSHSASLRDTTIRPDSIENSALLTSNVPYFLSKEMIPTCDADSSNASMRPKKTISDSSRSIIVTLSGVSRFFHVENLANASDEEAMFLFRLQFKMLANIKMLALEADGKADRAVREVISAMTRISEEVS